jgi:virginiamycin B lyase
MKNLFKVTIALSAFAAGIAGAAEVELPEGAGKQLIEKNCVQCHEVARIVAGGYSEQAWRNNVNQMLNVGSTLPKDQAEELIQYLSKHFPEKPKPKAVLVQGEVNVGITEWVVPTPGSRPHDPLATADGAIWYSGQFANLLGRLDPKTNQIKEYPLGPMTGPHGLIADKEGNIWYAANFGGHIGKLDPKTGKVVKYPMPDPKVRDVHTLIFDAKGMMFFTAQNANIVGRFNPQTGEIKIVPSPTKNSRPYGIVLTSKGIPFFVEFGSNKVASINPETLAITEYEMPNKASRPRRIAITSDDVMWLADYSRGFLTRFDPASGKFTEYASPSGPKSQPYGIIAVKDVIWYNESGAEPNTMVRFDPKTEKFQSWAIPSGGVVVRNVSVTPSGDIAIASSGVNRIGIVNIR